MCQFFAIKKGKTQNRYRESNVICTWRTVLTCFIPLFPHLENLQESFTYKVSWLLWSYNLWVIQIQTAFEAATNGQNTTTFLWGGFCQAPTCCEQAPLWVEEYQQRWRSNKICRRIDEAMENVLLLASLKMYTLKHFVIHLIYIRW